VRCAGGPDGCCASGQVCFASTCYATGAPCKDSFDCGESEFCEPTVGRCLPQPPGGATCEVRPQTPTFAPSVEWSWTSSTIKPTFMQVINMPVVIDLDKDGVPEVIIVTSTGFATDGVAYLRALDGKTGKEKWPATADVYKDGVGSAPDYTVGPRSTPAAADLDGDGMIEIVAAARAGGVIAFDAKGAFLWRSMAADGKTPYTGSFASTAVSLADLDGDGKGEVVVGGVVLDHTGKLVSDSSIGRERCGANLASYGAVSVVANVDGDPKTTQLHVVCGNRALRRDGALLWDVSVVLGDGYPAVADLDGDGDPELVVVGQGQVRVQNGTTGALLASLAMPGQGNGGPPTIADFDNDGAMEIASANGNAYSIFEYDPKQKKLSVKWSKATQDLSSNVTGSSVFDFEGDGAAEVVYNDECYSRVYRGTDGSELFSVPNSSSTIHEYPVLVDVDGDNNTEIVIVANDANHMSGTVKCASTGGAYQPRHGVFVYGDSQDRWVRTRRIWNQHAYHLTNVGSDGALPKPEPASWGPKGTNTFRVSSQGAGVFNAPDLQVDLELSTRACPTALVLRARVKNNGSLGVAAGVAVAFFLGADATGTPLGSGKTQGSLLPGQSEIVELTFTIGGKQPPFSFFVTVDGGNGAPGAVAECHENNNTAGLGGARCWGID
jgi:hypothetical protein